MVREGLYTSESIITSTFDSVKPKTTWHLLKPHFETLVSSFAFPQLCFTAEKKEMWRDDATEYLRLTFGWLTFTIYAWILIIQLDEYDDMESGISTATAFLVTLAKSRTNTTFLPTLRFIQTLLTTE